MILKLEGAEKGEKEKEKRENPIVICKRHPVREKWYLHRKADTLKLRGS